MKYLATCCPGLEEILAQEILEGYSCSTICRRGGVTFAADKTEGLYSIRCADNLYGMIGDIYVGSHRGDISEISIATASLPIKEVLCALGVRFENKKFFVNASRTGKHNYSRFEAADAIMKALVRAFGMELGTADHHDLSLRLDINQNKAELSVKLTSASFRFRGSKDSVPGAIRPTIAHAMVRLTCPSPEDIFLDPFCGSGTILRERLSLPHERVIGGDLDAAALAAAARNTQGLAVLESWDACHLPLPDRSITSIATNPPWGKQVALANEDQLYADFFREACRVIKPGGFLVVLTDQTTAMERACEASGHQVPIPITVSLHGILCRCYRFSI